LPGRGLAPVARAVIAIVSEALLIPLAVVTMAAALAAFFRSLLGVVLPLAVSGVTVVWTLGAYRLAGFQVNAITALRRPIDIILSLAPLAGPQHRWLRGLLDGAATLATGHPWRILLGLAALPVFQPAGSAVSKGRWSRAGARSGSCRPLPRRPKIAAMRLSIDGTSLAYIDGGPRDGEPIVLLHGYLGSHRSWRHLIEPLAARHRVLAFDWLGWGESGRPTTLSYAYDVEVDRLRRVLDALELPPVNLFAHDYGGFIGLGFCLRHPDRVRRMALLNSRAHRSFNRKWHAIFAAIGAAARTPAFHPLVLRQPLLAAHRASVRRELRAGIFAPDSFAYSNGWMDTPEGRRFSLRFFADYGLAERAELAGGLATIRCPTAIVWSRVNPYLDPRTPDELAARIPGAVPTRIEAGHFIMEEAPRAVLPALQALLAR
jgi:pimeloyl-ACP methyl ester carboxylesterase